MGFQFQASMSLYLSALQASQLEGLNKPVHANRLAQSALHKQSLRLSSHAPLGFIMILQGPKQYQQLMCPVLLEALTMY